MKTITIRLCDGKTRQSQEGILMKEFLKSLDGSLAQRAIAGKVNGQIVDLDYPLSSDCQVEVLTFDSPQGREIFRHSASHIMAQAVKELFPKAQLAIGPAIEEGFYYDFDLDATLSPEDLIRIEQKMEEIIGRNLPFQRQVVAKDEAIELFRGRNEPYKIELIEAIPDQTVSLYQQGDFIDLCRGPHILTTGRMRAFKLLSIAGAYWRGDEKNKMLQRIYGTAFDSKKELQDYLDRLEEAKRRDHRRLGKDLDLFSIQEEAGAGFVIYHPHGGILRSLLEEFEKKEHLKRGYQIVYGPQLLKMDLWKKSGHYDNYRQNMYSTEIDGQEYGIKPMNCLSHMLIYRSAIRSYRDLPLRYFELGTVYRHEKSGVLHGLMRVRSFTQDDAHILCTPDMLNDEIQNVLNFVTEIMAIFGFEYEMELSTRPEQSIGTDEDWDRATRALELAMQGRGIDYQINEGDGAFYGPKIDVKLRDALGRMWQCATIQCDFTLPERFDLTYIDAQGQRQRPVMLHRVILGSVERFIGVLIEHFAGAFPLWLSPVQVKVMTITERQNEYAENIKKELQKRDIRVETDVRNEKIGLKIREAQLQKIPYMVVIGDKEIAEGKINVRRRDGHQLGTIPLQELIQQLQQEIQEKWIRSGGDTT
ncbi:MAG: threonine--tRNA ligase [bacterium]